MHGGDPVSGVQSDWNATFMSVVGWFFSGRIASFRLLLEGDQFVFNSCEAFVEFLQTAEAAEDGLAE